MINTNAVMNMEFFGSYFFLSFQHIKTMNQCSSTNNSSFKNVFVEYSKGKRKFIDNKVGVLQIVIISGVRHQLVGYQGQGSELGIISVRSYVRMLRAFQPEG